MTPRTIAELLDDAIASTPDAPLLREGDRSWSYAEFGELVDRCTGSLERHGVGPGARVGLSAANRHEFAAAVFATARLGAAIVMISTAWREREVEHALALTDPTHVIHDGSGAVSLAELVGDRVLIELDGLAEGPPLHPSSGPALDDLAVMVFSSGTTGLPKAVRHTHRTMFESTRHWIEALGLTSADRLQIATPPFHILGLLNIVTVVAGGASVRLHRRFDLDAVLEAVGRDSVTIEMAVAPIAMAMASHPELERFDLSSLRYIMWGATPVTAAVAETVTRRTGVPFMPAYGASELPVISGNPVDRPGEWRLDSVGVPPTGVEVRVVDLETGEVLGADQVGELQARSASRMIGYLPESANAASIAEGEWYRTGDVGSIDANGWITITDRVKEMVKVNGFQVAPAEIESVLLGHPQVVDAAVYGVPDERTGEAPIAAVVLVAGATVEADELEQLVASTLASYKRVREVRIVDAIPRLPSGKVLRRELKDQHPA